jgi:hypothetical protein
MMDIEKQEYISHLIMEDEVDQTPYFHSYAEGDMESEKHTSDVIYSPKNFPVGTRIIVMVPTCERCNLHQGECDCGHNWEDYHYEQHHIQ